MPLVQVRLLEDVFSEPQKAELVKKLTDAVVSIKGEKIRPLTLVIVDEVKSGHWGVGGNALTTEAAKSLLAEKS